jgi:hypothetical protein
MHESAIPENPIEAREKEPEAVFVNTALGVSEIPLLSHAVVVAIP